MLLSCLVLAACDSSNEYETDRQSSSIENNQETSSSVILEETYQTNSIYDNQEKKYLLLLKNRNKLSYLIPNLIVKIEDTL